MLAHRKFARKKLIDCSRANYISFTHDAKLTPMQKCIVDLHILDKLPISEISSRLAFCESLIRKRLAEVYDKIAFL